jgi:PleD family two-component response regulator
VTEDNPPILVATDRVIDAEMIARVLGDEFARVHVSTDPKRSVHDLVLFKPAVLVLAFDTLHKAERYFQAVRQPEAMAQAATHRVLVLCNQDDMREVYERCKSGHFDDFVLFWPRPDETRPLRMAVRRALAQAIALRDGVPSAADFAAQARRAAALEPLLEDHIAKTNGDGVAEDALVPLLEAVRALRGLTERFPPQVLVVDDDRFQHKVLGQLLASVKAELTFATSATDAIAGLQKRRPDLILMDVSLPDVSGVEATRLLKSAAQFAAIPVIMITGVGGKAIVVESLKAGAADFVVKPFDKNVLLVKVRKALYGRAAAA